MEETAEYGRSDGRNFFEILSVDNFYFPFYHRDNSCAAQVQSFQKEELQ